MHFLYNGLLVLYMNEKLKNKEIKLEMADISEETLYSNCDMIHDLDVLLDIEVHRCQDLFNLFFSSVKSYNYLLDMYLSLSDKEKETINYEK